MNSIYWFKVCTSSNKIMQYNLKNIGAKTGTWRTPLLFLFILFFLMACLTGFMLMLFFCVINFCCISIFILRNHNSMYVFSLLSVKSIIVTVIFFQWGELWRMDCLRRKRSTFRLISRVTNDCDWRQNATISVNLQNDYLNVIKYGCSPLYLY